MQGTAGLDRLCRALFEASPLAYRVVDAEGVGVLENGAFVALFGSCAPDDQVGVTSTLLARALSGEVVRTSPLPLPTQPSSKLATFELELLPLTEGELPPLGGASVRHVAVAYRRVLVPTAGTASALGVDARERYLHRLEFILQNMPFSCAITDSNHRLAFVNAACERLLGYRAQELIGRNPLDFVPSEERASGLAQLEGVAQEQALPSQIGDVVTKDGRRLTGLWYSMPLFDAQGSIDGVLTLAVDITERALAERALQRSEQRYRSLIETTSAIVFTSDPEGQMIAPQAAWQAYTGQTWEQHRGLGWLDAIHPDDRAHLLVHAAETRKRLSAYQLEVRLFHGSSRKYRHSVVRGAPIFDEAHVVREWIGTVIDDEDRRQAADELLRLEAHAKQVQEANLLKNEFLANMSHELRTPLNAVLGFAELLADRVVTAESPQYDEFVGHILASGRHLLRLINEVLDLAKIEAGKFEFRPEPASIARLIDEVKSVLYSTGSTRGVRIDTVISPHLPEAVLDPVRFKQVLYNYLSNALKFSPADRIVTVRATLEDPSALRLEVEDHGEGIAPDDQPRLFAEFQQLESGISKRFGGTGLGLALTKRLVEAQGGRVGVSSAPGRGSTFFAVLPLRPETGTASPKAPARSWPDRLGKLE